MKQVILNINDNKYNFFMELIRNFDFVQIQNERGDSPEVNSGTTLTWDDLTDDQKNELHHIKKAFLQVELLQQGRLKTRSAKELLDEL